MTLRVARAAAWSLIGLALASVAATLLLWLYARKPTGGEGVFVAFILVLGLTFCATGAVLGARVPGNPVGWLLYVIGMFQIWNGLTSVYAIAALDTHPGSLPLGGIAGWASAWTWMPSVGLLATFLLLLFPNGHPPSPRWRWVGWLAGGALALAIGATMVEAWPLRADIDAIQDSNLTSPAMVAGFLLTGIAVLASIASLVVRYRRSSGDERQQLRWFTLAALFMVAGLPLGFTPLPGGELVFALGFFAIPIATAVSILKYRLYDLDLVVNKTIVYVTIVIVFSAVYVAIVVGIGSLVGAQGTSPVLAIGATAIVAVAFHPVRQRAQLFANRLVYGERATPYEVLSEFADRLSEAYSVDDVLPRMARLVAEGTGATEVRVWLRAGPELRPTASWPLGASPRDPVRGLADVGSLVFEVRHQGTPLGAIGVAMPASQALSPEQERLVTDVASQAGLVLRNVALVQDLRASRQRLVAAQDEERRRIERNIHDGAQQQLVALTVRLRLADSLVDRSPEKTHEMLAQLQAQTNDALEDLRDLARGIYPPLLADKGLPAALEAQARKSAVPTTVDADGVGRFGAEVEATLYFCVLEALTNVAKYARATSARVELSVADGYVAFEVTDDGDGFDPNTVGYGTGLQGMADRLEAMGGTLRVASAPGGGTTVAGHVPAGGEP